MHTESRSIQLRHDKSVPLPQNLCIRRKNHALLSRHYVEWIRDKYAHGDYSKIQAFLVAADFILPDRWQKSVERNYVSGLRDVKTDCWRSLSLVEYKYDASLRQAIYKIRDEE